MRKRLSFCAFAVALAAAAAWAGQVTLGGPLTVTPSQPNFAPGQQVQFQVSSGSNAAGIPNGAVFIIEHQQPNGTWAEVYRGTARTPALPNNSRPYAGGIFTWNQVTTQGATVPAGTYRVSYYTSNDFKKVPAQATFTIGGPAAAVPGTGVPVAPSGTGGLALALETPNVRPGELPRLRLQNTTSAALNLQGEHYVIQRNEGGRWVDVFSSSANGLHVATLNPGQVVNFTAPARERNGRLLTAGEYRIVFYAPGVTASPIAKNYRVEGTEVAQAKKKPAEPVKKK